MRGWSWASSAAFVSWGTLLRCTKRTGSPALAAHAAAGIAKAGSSAETTTTRSLLLPRAAVWKASSARASAKGSRPAMSVVRRPGGRATSPTRTTCAPPAALAPSGRRAASASRVASGMLGAVGEQDRGAHRRRGEDGSGDAGAPVAGVDERHGGGTVLGHRGGEDRPRHAGRVGDRVGAADARRVLGREGREAEVVDGLGRRALDAQAGRRRRSPWPSSCGRRGRTPSRRARRAGRRGRRRVDASAPNRTKGG